MKASPLRIPDGQDPSATHALWAIDEDDNRVAMHAHLIVKLQNHGAVRIAACGQKFTAANHLEGWWYVPHGELPLAEVQKIHCGLSQLSPPPPPQARA